MTKQQLIIEIERYSNLYLGFNAGVAGLSSKNKTQLESELTQMRLAYAFRLVSSVDIPDSKTTLFYAIFGIDNRDYLLASFLRIVASDLWLNASLDSAFNRALNNSNEIKESLKSFAQLVESKAYNTTNDLAIEAYALTAEFLYSKI